MIGHATSASARTGCTVLLSPGGAVAGVAVRGGAPGTRETDLLRAENRVDRVHAILLTGGSAFGLAAADGVVRWLAERGSGWPTSAGPVPIVPAAVIFDLKPDRRAWPDADLGYAACENATSDWPAEGSAGAGYGATVGKFLGIERSSPGGVGVSGMRLPDGTIIGALVVVNAVGHVVDPNTGRILAGPRLPNGAFGDSVKILLSGQNVEPPRSTSTTIGAIWTDAPLDKAACNRVANVAHNGLARTIRPVHTQHDGDTLFMLAMPPKESAVAPAGERRASDLTLLGVAASEVIAQAVVRAVALASSST